MDPRSAVGEVAIDVDAHAGVDISPFEVWVSDVRGDPSGAASGASRCGGEHRVSSAAVGPHVVPCDGL
eukprot:622642-Prymnesium_polylepis.1